MRRMFTQIVGAIAAMTAFAGPACAMKPELVNAPAPISRDAEMNAYILLDRTGSMSSIWDEALNSVNVYAASLGTQEEDEIGDVDASVTLAVFDAQDGLKYDVLRERASAKDWKKVTNDEASPRGMTPLFDAIGRIVSTAESDKPEKAVIVIMTDGRENSSRELTKDGAKAALARAEAKGWEVVFLGAEFASFDDAESVGMDARKTMAVGQGSMQDSMSALAKKSRAYGKGEEAEIEFNEEDRALADEEGVKERQNK